MIYWELFRIFFMIGAFTFGGGYAMIAMVQQQAAARGWMSAEALVDFIAIAESTPGPIAVNLATFVGAQQGGVMGAVCATVGVVLPSFVVILLVARCYAAFCKSKWVKGIMSGLKPAVVGLIGSAVLTVAVTVISPGASANWLWAALVAVMLGVTLKFPKLHPIAIICLCGAVGILVGFLGL